MSGAVEISFIFAQKKDVHKIVRLINCENKRSGAVMKVTPGGVMKWIESRHSVIGMCNGRIVAHEAMNVWPRSGWVELRSLVVSEGFRGQGIGYSLTKMLIDSYRKKKRKGVFVALKNRTEKGNGILVDLGFREIDIYSVPMELFTIRSYSERKAFRLDL